jgi:hypothetical protein
MQGKVTLPAAIQKLDETDRLLVETSPLPDKVREQIADQLIDDRLRIKVGIFLAVGSAWIVVFSILGLLTTVASTSFPLSSSSSELTWVFSSVALSAFSASSIVCFLDLHLCLKDRSSLRAKLIRGEG